MSGSKIANACDAAAKLAGDERARIAWAAIADVLRTPPAKSVRGVLKALDGVAAEPAAAGRASFRDITAGAGPIQELVSAVGGAAAIADFSALLEWLGAREDADVESFARKAKAALAAPRAGEQSAKPIDRRLVGKYATRLEETLGDESFSALHQELKADKAVKVAEAKEIARQFTGRPGTSRANALQRIWDRHRALIDGRKRIEAMDGRSAA